MTGSLKLPSGFLFKEVQREGHTDPGAWRCFRKYEPPPYDVSRLITERRGDERYAVPPHASKLTSGTLVKVVDRVASIKSGASKSQNKPPVMNGYFMAFCLGREQSEKKSETRRYGLLRLGGRLFIAPPDAFELRSASEKEETVSDGDVTAACHLLYTNRSVAAVNSALREMRRSGECPRSQAPTLRPANKRGAPAVYGDGSPALLSTPKPKVTRVPGSKPADLKGWGPVMANKVATPEILEGLRTCCTSDVARRFHPSQ